MMNRCRDRQNIITTKEHSIASYVKRCDFKVNVFVDAISICNNGASLSEIKTEGNRDGGQLQSI